MSARPTIRVMIADDHRLFRAGLRTLLQTYGDFEVVAEAADGREALRLVAAHRPDLTIAVSEKRRQDASGTPDVTTTEVP